MHNKVNVLYFLILIFVFFHQIDFSPSESTLDGCL